MVVRDALRPEHDRGTRRRGFDDPTGGVLDGRRTPLGLGMFARRHGPEAGPHDGEHER